MPDTSAATLTATAPVVRALSSISAVAATEPESVTISALSSKPLIVPAVLPAYTDVISVAVPVKLVADEKATTPVVRASSSIKAVAATDPESVATSASFPKLLTVPNVFVSNDVLASAEYASLICASGPVTVAPVSKSTDKPLSPAESRSSVK